MFWAYVLRSESTGKFYKGHTNDLDRRIQEHNETDKDTRKYTHKDPGPWRLVHSETFDTRAEAMKHEKWLKSGQGREWLKQFLVDHSR